MSFIRADLNAPSSVLAGVTDRIGGVSSADFSSFNLALHVGDMPDNVMQNRTRFAEQLNLSPSQCQWLDQVHGREVFVADATTTGKSPKADAVITRTRGIVCSVLTADCLPILLSNQAGTEVAAIHAGWRSLSAGVIEHTIKHMLSDAKDIVAWFGPAIGPNQFEVGQDVLEAFSQEGSDKESIKCFQPIVDKEWKYLANIYRLAQLRCVRAGIDSAKVKRTAYCTVEQPQWFSYRREKNTGRMASFIMLR
jgi:hypothetical protein